MRNNDSMGVDGAAVASTANAENRSEVRSSEGCTPHVPAWEALGCGLDIGAGSQKRRWRMHCMRVYQPKAGWKL